MITIIHKNVLSTYLSDWRNKIEYLPRVGEPKGPVSGYKIYGKEDKKVIHHASLSKRDGIKAFDYGSIRDNLGQLLKNVQAFIDSLLDALDERFRVCYGYVQSELSWTETITDGGRILYWAYKYGSYRHGMLRVREADSDASEGGTP